MGKRKTLRLSSLLAAGVVALGLIVVPSAPAQAASFYITDGFESNPSATWSFDGQGSHGGSFQPYIGVNYTTAAFIGASGTTSWASVGRSVYIPPRGQGQNTNCKLYFSVKRNQYAQGHAYIRLEVIHPTTWEYVTYSNLTLLLDAEWGRYSTPIWYNGPSVIFARIAVSTNSSAVTNVHVDNMAVSCNVS